MANNQNAQKANEVNKMNTPIVSDNPKDNGTCKHYEDMANIINNGGVFKSLATAETFADLFEKDNQNFNRIKFLRACGVRA
jgi:hypothetical protein